MNSKTANTTFSSSPSNVNQSTIPILASSKSNGESTAPNSTATTTNSSDHDSSVSTLSPATTPSMDYGNQEPLEYAPVFYPGFYDENGMLLIRKLREFQLKNCSNY